MTKREMMIRAHGLAKTMVGNYSARLALALRQLWASLKKGVATVVELIGSEKQVKWANDIREKFMADVAKLEEFSSYLEEKNVECNAKRGKNAGWYDSLLVIKNAVNELKMEVLKNSSSKYFIECSPRIENDMFELLKTPGNCNYIANNMLDIIRYRIRCAVAGKVVK